MLCDAALAALPEDDLAGRARVLAQRALAESETGGWASVDAPSAEALRLAERSGRPRPRRCAAGPSTRGQPREGVAERLDLAERRSRWRGRGRPCDAELWGRLWRIDAALQLGHRRRRRELVQLAVLADGSGAPIAGGSTTA